MELDKLLKECVGFEWDEGNARKSTDKHNVSKGDSEQVFFNQPLIVFESYGLEEERFLALGKTNQGRRLAVIFTIRKKKLIRVISARDMSKKERKVYGKES